MERLNLLILVVIGMALIPTTALAKASNDSSYKFGYSAARNNLTGMITVPPSWHDPNLISDICDVSGSSPERD